MRSLKRLVGRTQDRPPKPPRKPSKFRVGGEEEEAGAAGHKPALPPRRNKSQASSSHFSDGGASAHGSQFSESRGRGPSDYAGDFPKRPPRSRELNGADNPRYDSDIGGGTAPSSFYEFDENNVPPPPRKPTKYIPSYSWEAIEALKQNEGERQYAATEFDNNDDDEDSDDTDNDFRSAFTAPPRIADPEPSSPRYVKPRKGTTSAFFNAFRFSQQVTPGQAEVAVSASHARRNSPPRSGPSVSAARSMFDRPSSKAPMPGTSYFQSKTLDRTRRIKREGSESEPRSRTLERPRRTNPFSDAPAPVDLAHSTAMGSFNRSVNSGAGDSSLAHGTAMGSSSRSINSGMGGSSRSVGRTSRARRGSNTSNVSASSKVSALSRASKASRWERPKADPSDRKNRRSFGSTNKRLSVGISERINALQNNRRRNSGNSMAEFYGGGGGASSDAGGNHEEPDPPAPTFYGPGCYLYFEPKNGGTVYCRWTETGEVEPDALGFFSPARPVARYKYKQNNGRHDIIKIAGEKFKLFEGVAHFIKEAAALKAEFIAMDSHVAQVDLYMLDFNSRVRFVRIGEPIDATEIDAIAILPRDNLLFEGIEATSKGHFLSTAGKQGHALALRT